MYGKMLAVCLCLFLAGCSQADVVTPETEYTAASIYDMTVVSGTNTYEPYKNFTFSESVQLDANGKEQVINDCGRWLRVQDVEKMPVVPYAPDIEIQVAGDPVKIEYGLYDESYEPLNGGDVLIRSVKDIQLPGEPVPYYVKLALTFENETGSIGYQYFFPGFYRPTD